MTTLAAPTGNDIQNTLAATYERGADTEVTLTDGADFPNSAHVIRISESSAKWCLIIYTTKATHVLTMGGGAADYALANNYVTDGTAVFAIGSTVELVCAADEIAQLFTQQALRLSAAAVVVDHTLVRGDGGARGTQDTGIAVDDSDNMAFPNAAYASIDKVRARDGDGLSLQDDGGNGPFIADGGSVINAAQPAFLAIADGTQTNVAINTYVTVLLATERFDQGNDFASSTFTAPVTGKYQLNATFYMADVDSASTEMFIVIETSNFQYYIGDWQVDKVFSSDSILMLTGSVLADMDVNDTAYIRVYQIAGTAQGDVHNKTCFSGFLAC